MTRSFQWKINVLTYRKHLAKRFSAFVKQFVILLFAISTLIPNFPVAFLQLFSLSPTVQQFSMENGNKLNAFFVLTFNSHTVLTPINFQLMQNTQFVSRNDKLRPFYIIRTAKISNHTNFFSDSCVYSSVCGTSCGCEVIFNGFIDVV